MPVLYLLLTYLVAATPFGLVVSTLYGTDIDLRGAGSGNIGTTNVARVFGWKLAAPVLALDILKGFLPVLAAPLILPDAGLWWGALVGAAAFIGHCWPVYLEFRGGKGVATGAGAMLALAPVPTLVAAAVWGAVLAITGRSSVAALGAAVSLIGLTAWLTPPVLAVAGLLAVGVLVRHVANIRRLVAGEEKAVVRPVRWGSRGGGPSADEVLQQGPGGTERTVPLWREEVVDPTDPGVPLTDEE